MSTEERDRAMGHAAEADGIEEYDNALPSWWVGLFAVCIVWAGAYTVQYHVTGHRSQRGEYAAELASAEASRPKPTPAPASGATTDDPALVEAGKALFATNCVGCHGATATGGVGPNLTDTAWIHGGTVDAIATTIRDGVPAKGMVTWGPILGEEKVTALAAYVHSLGGGR